MTLHKNKLNFNTQIEISNDGGQLSGDSGLVLVQEFLHKIGFMNLLKSFVHIKDNRINPDHSYPKIIMQLILQAFAGYRTDSAANTMKDDPIMKNLLGGAGASQPTISRMPDQVTKENLAELEKLNLHLCQKYYLMTNLHLIILDLDTTHYDTHGKQENADYNSHYGTNGFQPLMVFEGNTGLCLKSELRPGSTYSSKDVAKFLRPILKQFRTMFPDKRILVRGDSGFATPELYELAEEYNATYVIKLKRNSVLNATADDLVQPLLAERPDKPITEVHYFEFEYQAGSWTKARRVVMKSTRKPDELLFTNQFIVTDLSKTVSPKEVFQTYNKRGTMENFIKETKNGFHADKTDSTSFLKNAFRMMLNLLAYNLFILMKLLVFPDKLKSAVIATVRFQLIKVAAKVTKSARKIRIKLESAHVFEKEFWETLGNIQQFSW